MVISPCCGRVRLGFSRSQQLFLNWLSGSGFTGAYRSVRGEAVRQCSGSGERGVKVRAGMLSSRVGVGAVSPYRVLALEL